MFLGRPRRFGRSLSLDVIFFKKLWCFPNLYVSLQKIKEHCKVLENQISKDRHIQYAFRILHIDNIPHVLKYGLVHKESSCANGHALNNMSKFYEKSDLSRLDELVLKEDVYATFWFNQNPWDDRKR